MSWHAINFRITDPVWGETTDRQFISPTKDQ